LILIVLPTLVGSASLLALNGLWRSSNDLILRSQQISNLCLSQTEAFSDLVPYCSSALSFTFQGDQQKKLKAKRDRDQLSHSLDALKLATADGAELKLLSPESKALPADIAATVDDADRICQSLSTEVFTSNVARFKAFSRLMKDGLVLSAKLQSASQFQNKQVVEIEQQYDTVSSVIGIGLIFALGFTAITCGSVLILYTSIVFSRFEVVRKNAARLTLIGGPKPELQGDDELAYLDKTFCAVGQELQKAADANNMLMQMVAHDVRSPVMAAQVSIQMFEELLDDKLTGEIALVCEAIEQRLGQVLDLVTNFLLIEKLESGLLELEYSEFSLDQCLQECIAQLRKQAISKELTIKNNCPQVMIRADAAQVKRVLRYFLASSLRAAPEGSVVTIDAKQESGNITIRFSDFGEPPAVSDSKQLFSKFFVGKLDRQRSDRALGLALSKLILEQHEGYCGFISASSTTSTPSSSSSSSSGPGCSIWFTLPLNKSIGTMRTVRADDTSVAALRDWKSIFRPGLARQGLILALVPLCFQFTCLLWLSGEVSKAASLQAIAREQSRMVDLANHLWLNGVAANANMGFFMVSGDQRSKRAAQQNINALKILPPQKFSVDSGGSTTEGLWRETIAFTLAETARMEALLNGTNVVTAAVDLGTLPAFAERSEIVSDKLRALLRAELKRLAQAREAQEQVMRSVNNALLLMLALNIGGCLVLLAFFVYRTKRRLDRLVANAARLPKRGALAPLLSGSDELQELDYLIHQAESYLRLADKQHALLIDIIIDEIENPISASAGSLDELDAFARQIFQSQSNEQIQKCLKLAKANNLRVLSLVTQLLTVERDGGELLDLDLTSVALPDVLARAAESVASLLESKCISLQISCPYIQARLDSGRIVQVLVNLLGNAIKFSPVNSTIALAAVASNGVLKLSVTDNGPGVDSETAGRVFDKFFKSSDQKGAAFGLGLAICKLIVESHRGTIGVDSQPGKGSTFWLLLPDAV
jgi:signal transduction histidine kinase